MIMRLLPTFFTENFGRVSCACEPTPVRNKNKREKNCFDMMFKRKKNPILLIAEAKITPHSKKAKRLTFLFPESHCPATLRYEQAAICYAAGKIFFRPDR